MSAGAVKTMVTALGAEFERESGNKLNLNFGTAGSLRERIKNGEVSDLVVLSESAIAELAELGLVVPGSSADLGRTVTGVIVRDGTPEPDISTPDAFKQALLDARSVAYTDPKAGGSGGIMNEIDRKTSAVRSCPICGKPVEPAFKPFCSKRCADIDLNRWLSGVYAVPAKDEEDEDGERPAEGEAGDR